MNRAAVHRGSCVCGAVTFEVGGALEGPDACHCSICRKVSGHYWASTDIPRELVTISGEDSIRWYQSSEKVRRGFCSTCGTPLFWDSAGRAKLGISMGAFEKPTDTHLVIHIFTADKGDYYEIADSVPKNETHPQ
jgi:hypothetical protein